jgi:hypothetical protein
VEEENRGVIVENAWKLAMEGRSGQVQDAVCGVVGDLWDWSRNILGDWEMRIKHVRRALEACRK